MKKPSGYGRNIPLNYLYVFTMSLDVTQGIWMLYLASKGMSLFQLGLLEGIFHLTSVAMETPTGAIADLYGRKGSRVLGRLLFALSALIMVAANGFAWFALVFVLWGLSYNLESGAGEALLYDSLREMGEEHRFMKVTGLNEFLFQSAGVAALLAGGWIGKFNYRYVFLTAAALGAVALLEALFFREVPVGGAKPREGGLAASMRRQYADSWKAVASRPRLAYLLTFLAVIASFVTLTFYYMQNYLKGRGFNPFEIGMVLAGAAFSAAFGGLLSDRVDRAMGEAGVLKWLPFATAAGLWGLAWDGSLLPCFLLLNGLDSILYVTLSSYINKLIESDKRATILSAESMLFSLSMIVIFPLFGKGAELLGYRPAFMVLAFLATAMAFWNFVLSLGQAEKGGPSKA